MSLPAAPRVPFRALRRALLVVLVLLVVGIGGLYLLGREESAVETGDIEASERSRRAPGRRGADPFDPDGGAIAWSEGFEFEQKVGDRSAFRLRGDRFATDREGVTRLEGVVLELAREGEPYRVSSRRAIWNPSTQEARFVGAVRLAGGDELWLESPRLDLVEDGRFLVSRDPARFGSSGGLEGRSNRLRFDFEQDRLVLQGKVRAVERPKAGGDPMTLEAPQVVYARSARKLVASGDVELTSGLDRLRAREILVELEADAETPRRATARGAVAGGIQLGPAPEETSATGVDAEAGAAEPAAGAGVDRAVDEERAEPPVEDPEGLEQGDEEEGSDGRVRFRAAIARVELAGERGAISALVLEGEEDAPARIGFRSSDGSTRLLVAPTVSARVESGRLREATAEGGVRIRERSTGASGERRRRNASAERALARFDDEGSLEHLALDGEVRVREPQMEATGERAEIEIASGSGVLLGGEQPARAVSERGELEAPEIRFDRGGARVHAEGGVRATLESSQDSGLELGPAGSEDGEGPIRVQARSADWDDAERTWSFDGDVRAAQGDRLLFAEHLEGSEAPGETVASGGVRTLWRQTGSGGAAPVQTAVSADRLVYRADSREVEYTGSVTVRQLERELSCERLLVELDESRRARRMNASGGIRLVERDAGRSAEGSSAVHDLLKDTILIVGEPVALREADGSTLRGPRLLYDVATGRAQMVGPEGAP